MMVIQVDFDKTERESRRKYLKRLAEREANSYVFSRALDDLLEEDMYEDGSGIGFDPTWD